MYFFSVQNFDVDDGFNDPAVTTIVASPSFHSSTALIIMLAIVSFASSISKAPSRLGRNLVLYTNQWLALEFF